MLKTTLADDMLNPAGVPLGSNGVYPSICQHFCKEAVLFVDLLGHFPTCIGQVKEVAEQIYEKHRFFTDRLIEAGVDPETAERDACRIEHVISKETFERLKATRKLSGKAVISSDES